jgi:hypothetical protein
LTTKELFTGGVAISFKKEGKKAAAIKYDTINRAFWMDPINMGSLVEELGI